MATPNYFSRFPDIKYGVKMNKAGVIDYIHIKDYFLHLRMIITHILPKSAGKPLTATCACASLHEAQGN